MTTEEFEIILQNRISKIQSVLGNKAKEYALNGDRLHNFKIAGMMNNESPEKALWGMATKHLVSVQDIVKDRININEYLVDEKCGDLINYIILLEALLIEKIKLEKDTL